MRARASKRMSPWDGASQTTPRPIDEKSDVGEPAGIDRGENIPGDQITADDKENIDPGIAAGKCRETRMKQQDTENGDGAKPIDFRPVGNHGCLLITAARW